MRVIEVPKNRLWAVWTEILPGLEEYRKKSPHETPTNWDLFRWLQSPEGDELVVFSVGGKYGGFLTFKVQPFEDEVWGTIAIIFLTKEAQHAEALPELARQLEVILKQKGCTVMNYLTRREGFRKLAPRLGFSPGITEWRKEL